MSNKRIFYTIIIVIMTMMLCLCLGCSGQKGEQGEPGVPGAVGGIGPQGPQGDQGAQGPQGTSGNKGESAYDIYCKYHPAYKGTEQEWINDLASGKIAESYNTTYNIIYTVATIPPVIASLECIANGYETYAFIERGKTYSGISDVEKFHNIGFDTANNLSNGLSQNAFDAVVNTIKELNVYGNEKFNIYCCDYSGLWGFGLAANAGLMTEQFHIYLCEDGANTYNGFNTIYVKDKTVSNGLDQPYETMNEHCDRINDVVDTIMSKTDNKISDITVWLYDYTFPLASLANVTYLIQDEVRIKSYLESLGNGDIKTKLLSAIGFDGYTDDVDFKLNFQFGSITDRVNPLNDEQRENYLKLMYGEYYDDTYNALTRTTIGDGTTAVPTKKLVFISSRVKSYHKFASNTDGNYSFGSVYAKDIDDVPDNYEDLNSMYKSEFLFANEDDYKLFINQFNISTNYNNDVKPDQSVINSIKVDCFNYYIDYLFTLKFTYLKYGDEYDIILKGHPSEVLGEYQTWTQHFGTAAENLAYLGVDIALCGFPSSTYTGYDQSIDIKFVMSRVNTAIDEDTNLAGRYEDGTLLDHVNGEERVSLYLNIGNMYKEMISFYSTGEAYNIDKIEQYENLFAVWLRKVNGLDEDANVDGYDVDEQGFLIVP